MMLINQAKRNDHGEHSKWYSIHQKKMFRYLRLLAISLCLLYIPFICAYTIDKSNGKQTSKRWVWGLVITIIVILFVVRVVKDYRIVKARQNESKESSMKALVFSSKPLKLWSQAKVISWINIGAMHEESYFSDATRYRIAAKLKDACIYGKLLSELASDAEKLAQFVGLSYHIMVMLLCYWKKLLSSAGNQQSNIAWKLGLHRHLQVDRMVLLLSMAGYMRNTFRSC